VIFRPVRRFLSGTIKETCGDGLLGRGLHTGTGEVSVAVEPCSVGMVNVDGSKSLRRHVAYPRWFIEHGATATPPSIWQTAARRNLGHHLKSGHNRRYRRCHDHWLRYRGGLRAFSHSRTSGSSMRTPKDFVTRLTEREISTCRAFESTLITSPRKWTKSQGSPTALRTEFRPISTIVPLATIRNARIGS
jgi:hypothetical protein